MLSPAKPLSSALLIGTLLLAACGFTPLYGTHPGSDYGNETLLEYIYIDNIADREGQYLRNALIDRFYRDGRPVNPTFTLSITAFEARTIDLDLTEEADTTREQLRLRLEFRLLDRRTGETLLRRDVINLASYNVLESEFATRISRKNAMNNALDGIAAQIENQIVLYFERSAKDL